MYEIAEQVTRWLGDARPVRVAQVVATRGFSSRDPRAALAWTGEGDTVGALVPGVAVPVPSDAVGLVEVVVSDADAVAAGLSCGGVASVFVQDAAAYPDEAWDRLVRREPLCLVHSIDERRTHVFTPATVRTAEGIDADVPRLFGRGTTVTALLEGSAVVALWPPTTLLVVGDGVIATALADLAGVLGWTAQVSTDGAAGAAERLTESDAFVVLSHDRAVDVPALAAALAGRAGYVGGLGSRRTQAARREALLARGVEAEALARVHGPAGLDIDARTPGEVAVAIVAEIVAARSGASGGSISARSGPVHS